MARVVTAKFCRAKKENEKNHLLEKDDKEIVLLILKSLKVKLSSWRLKVELSS